jgi:peptidoglycan/LPS O-acetylase OafA/YrhL
MKNDANTMINPKLSSMETKVIPMRMAQQTNTWFPGLNALRFFAAGLVVVMHIHNNMGISGVRQLPAFPLLFKGLTAVSFFFVLSGFLITYLLLQELQATATVSIKKFYLRRVFRIWPLYFIIVCAGMLFYWKLVPAMHLHFENDYPHGLAILLYTFFLANLMSSLYHVGGMLHIAWSIAVEEQFYLFWAPLVKQFNKKLPLLIIGISLLALVNSILNSLNVYPVSKEIKAFLDTLQFHYMGLGAGFAWLLYYRKNWLLQLPVFTSKLLQWICTAALGSYLLLYMKTPLGDALSPLPLGILFGWLIINVSSNEHRIFSLENKPLNYLGKISYGIYMYHMPVVYATAFLFQKLGKGFDQQVFYFPGYFLFVFLLTISIASFSYHFIEQPLLKKSKRLF